MEFVDGQVKTANRSKATRKRSGSDQICPEDQSFTPIIEQEVFDKAQAKLAAAKKRTIRAPNTVQMWLKGFVVCGEVRQAHANPSNGLPLLQLLPLGHAERLRPLPSGARSGGKSGARLPRR